MTIYEYLLQMTDGYDDKTAITYFGKEISFGEFKSHILEAARVLSYMGVKECDRVLFLMPNIPETAYLLYACSMLGAVADFIDPRPDSPDPKISAQRVLTIYCKERSSYIIALDLCFAGMIAPCIDRFVEAGLKKCAVVSADLSMDGKTKVNYFKEQIETKGLKNAVHGLKAGKPVQKIMDDLLCRYTDTICLYSDLLKQSQSETVKPWVYRENKIAVIVHSSGTSNGSPKPIPLTNDNMNAYVHQSFVSNMTMEVGDGVLFALPYFAAFGIVDLVHAGLCHVNNLIQITAFEPRLMGYWIKKYRPQTIIGTPSWYLLLLNDKYLKRIDLSFLKMITYGGDSMAETEETRLNNFLTAHNCNHKITKGHGMSETCGCGSYAIGEYNLPGSIGIPMAYSTYAVMNPDTLEPVRFEPESDYIEGELIIASPMVFPGELDGTAYAEFVTFNGVRYIRTKDMARMYRDGVMFFQARLDRTFSRYDGYKVKPYEVESIVLKTQKVKNCCITPYFDEEKKGLMPRLTLCTGTEMQNVEKKELVQEIIDSVFCHNAGISSRQIPSRVAVIKELPLTVNGKTDFNALKEIQESDYRVIFEENSVLIGKISII